MVAAHDQFIHFGADFPVIIVRMLFLSLKNANDFYATDVFCKYFKILRQQLTGSRLN